MSVATLFEKLRGRRERGGDVWSLARRVAAGEDIAVDAIISGCAAAGMDTTAFESAVGLCQRRAAWRRQLAGRAEIDRERAAVSSKIEVLNAGLRRAQELHASSVEISLVEKSLAEKPTASPERAESRAWLAARADREAELSEQLDHLRAKAENAAARIAELAPLAAKAKAKLDEAEQAAFDF